jgi:hypothetical protein
MPFTVLILLFVFISDAINSHCHVSGIITIQVCAGGNAPFSYYGNNVGVTVTWSFPGGVPPTASGPGPHSINYPVAGVYPFSMVRALQ